MARSRSQILAERAFALFVIGLLVQSISSVTAVDHCSTSRLKYAFPTIPTRWRDKLIKITMALDPKLTAQNRGHWSTYRKNIKATRETARLLAGQPPNKPIKGRAIVDYLFFVPDRKHRDEANMIHSCKAMIDGVVDSKMIQGDHWEALSTGGVAIIVGGFEVVTVQLTFRSA